MERAPALCLLLTTLLAFYFLVPSNAVPLSRVQRVTMQEDGQIPLVSVESSTLEPKMKMERFVSEDESMVTTRMAIETQDYAPPGPNNHHKPPGWR